MQRRTLASEPLAGLAPPDLEDELRPALLRIGERAARLVVALPAPLDCAEVRRRVADAIRSVDPGAQRVRALADSLVAVGGGACPQPQPAATRAPTESMLGGYLL